MHSSRVDDVGPCKAGSLGARKLVLGIGYTASHRAGSSNQRILGEDRYSDPVMLAVLCMQCLQGLTNVHELAPLAVSLSQLSAGGRKNSSGHSLACSHSLDLGVFHLTRVAGPRFAGNLSR